MSLLASPSLLLSPTHKHASLVSPAPQKQSQTLSDDSPSPTGQLSSSSSIASLVSFVRNPLEGISEVVEDWMDGSTKQERVARQALQDRKQLLYVKLRTVATRFEWEAAAAELDDLEGNNEWKRIVESTEYDAPLIQARLQQLDDARISCDIGRMLFLIRTSLTRDLGDMGSLRMYKHSHIGTKDLVERYITSALETLDALLDVSSKAKCDAMESKYILEQVLAARQAFGRSALLLSGGAVFGMNHIGVLKALWEARLLPRIISGASAGSIVCAVVCTRIDEEIPELLATFCDGNLNVFDDDEGIEAGVLAKVARFLKHGALYDIEHLTRVMKELLGDMTFQEAYNRTRKILNICVSSANLYEMPRLLNYITAPNVLIWSAVAASCSVPFIYTAASLLAKDPKTGEAVPWNPTTQRWIDGSVDNDIPMTRLAEMFNVNHFIVSQVNPHVVPFLAKEEGLVANGAHDLPANLPTNPTWLDSISHLAKAEALHRLHTLAEIGIFPNLLTKTVSILSQKYSGDITILPEISYADMPRLLSNPTKDFMAQATLAGERATWPKIGIIRNHCAIELALDDAVQKLRTRVVFSPSEVESRMSTAHVKRNSITGSTRTLRKRTNKQRPTSQHSAQEPAAARPSSSQSGYRKGGTAPPHPQAPILLPAPASPSSHKKTRSINTVLAQGSTSFFCQGTKHTEYFEIPRTVLHDVTSSGAEETTMTSANSSTTSLASSTPTEAPPSPRGDSSPETSFKWQQPFRHGFPQATSQPNTPYQVYPAATSSGSSSNTTTPTTPKGTPFSASQNPLFAMTPASATGAANAPGGSSTAYDGQAPQQSTAQSSNRSSKKKSSTSSSRVSSPESKYKRLFHPSKAARASNNTSNPSPFSTAATTAPRSTSTSTRRKIRKSPGTSSVENTSNTTSPLSTSPPNTIIAPFTAVLPHKSRDNVPERKSSSSAFASAAANAIPIPTKKKAKSKRSSGYNSSSGKETGAGYLSASPPVLPELPFAMRKSKPAESNTGASGGPVGSRGRARHPTS